MVDAPAPPGFGNGRLVAWLILAGVFAVDSAAVFSSVQSSASDVFGSSGVELYAISIIVVSVLNLGLVLWIALGIRFRDVLALRPVLAGPRHLLGLHRPRAWRWALGAIGAIVVGSYAFDILFDAIFGPFAEAGRFQAVVGASEGPQLVLIFLAVVVLGPIVEELMYRGLGYGLLERFGTWTAIGGTAVLFGLAHGSLALLPVFVVTGLALGWLRSRTGSIYPGVLVHGVYNGVVMLLAVAFA